MATDPKGVCLRLATVTLLFLVSVSLLARAQDEKRQQPQVPQEAEDISSRTPPAQGTPDESPAQPVVERGELGPDYVLGPEDLVTISVFNLPELNETVRVENDGTIAVKLLGHVQAAGLTTGQLRERLEKEWGKSYLEDPRVTVYIGEFHARPVSVIGAVEKPGEYVLPGPRSLIEVLAMAGGLSKKSGTPAGRWLIVTRKAGFGNLPQGPDMQLVSPNKLRVPVQKLYSLREDALNVPIHPFDIISVSKADIVYVMGAVGKPGEIVLEDHDTITVLQALAMAEGTSRVASKKSAEIIRTKEDGTREQIPLNIGKLLKSKAPDVQMAANDILYIPGSRSKESAQRTIDTAIGTLSGLIIYRY